MVANYKVKKGRCNGCLKDDKILFILRFRRGPIIEIMPATEEVEEGLCQDCLQYYGKKLSKNRSYSKYAIDINIESEKNEKASAALMQQLVGLPEPVQEEAEEAKTQS